MALSSAEWCYVVSLVLSGGAMWCYLVLSSGGLDCGVMWCWDGGVIWCYLVPRIAEWRRVLLSDVSGVSSVAWS